MASVAELQHELGDLASFLATREALGGDAAATARISTSMVSSFCTKIGYVPKFDTSAALKLIQAVQATAMAQNHKDNIQKAIDDRLSGSVAQVAAQKWGHGTTVCQKLLSNITEYLTQSDWDRLRDDSVSVLAKQQVITDRLVRLGIRFPHEQTIKWAVAVLVVQVEPNMG